MLGIWHGGECLKRDLAQSFYGCVEHGSPILGLDFASLMKGYFSLYIYENYDGLYVVYMDVISLVFLSLLCLIMLFIYMFYDNNHEWLSSCSYLLLRDQCIYDLMDDMEANVTRRQ